MWEAYVIPHNKGFGGVFKTGIQGSFDGAESAFITCEPLVDICFNGMATEGLFKGELSLLLHVLFLSGE